MITLHHFISSIKNIRRSSYQDPARDWLILITFAFIALVGIVVWGAWAFDTVANGGVIGAPAPQTHTVFDSSSLTTIQKVFESRAAEEAKYVTGTYRFVDPSQ